MSTAAEFHELNLVSSSKLKLRATARLAEGSDDAIFDACVLFHEAARLERRAVEALSPCPPETRLAGSIEECWCLLEGRDPNAAANVWSRILDEADAVPSATAESMLSRLRPRYDRSIREFAKKIQAHPLLARAGHTQVLVPPVASAQKSALAQLEDVLREFPGIAELWAGAARLAEVTGQPSQAWQSLNRAIRLAPDNASFRALSLLSAAETLRPAEADRYLSQVYGDLQRAEAEVCLMYAFSELLLAERSAAARSERWKRALTAVNAAFPKARSEWISKNLTGVRLFLEALLAKRKADPDLLYRAGLGRLAATSGHRPIDALRADATARVGAMSGSDAAA